ncbi:Astacin (Peptidase family M12A) [Pleomorphomonas diazotrophica]|nr:M12 family metallopeptidase [Pleomorphomonas diazotrophica]SFM96091.1 Astacin (Peptidase family M12A) [Pleomorphomonas diazotrophica]
MRFHVILAFAVTLFVAGSAGAHNEWGTFNPEFNDEAGPLLTEVTDLANSTSDEDKRYFFSRALLWRPGQILKACFIGGTQAERNSIFNSAARLLNGARINVSIDFQSTNPFPDCKKNAQGLYTEEIRIAVGSGVKCCSARIGRNGMKKRNLGEANIFLGGAPQGWQVWHELIHALGFFHEHQKPDATCRFNYAEIKRLWGWDEATVKANFDRLNNDERDLRFSSGFDRKSIMDYYQSSPTMLVDGAQSPCYNPAPAQTLTGVDYEGLRLAYPMSAAPDAHRQRVARVRAVVDLSGVSPELRELLDME